MCNASLPLKRYCQIDDASAVGTNGLSTSRFLGYRLDLFSWIAGLIVVVLLSTMPLAETILFGGDEGQELMKGFLVFHGYRLYQPVWSDQPPLYTALLSSTFSYFGDSALVPRLISVASTGICAVVIFRLVVLCGGGLLGGFISSLLLLGCQGWLLLGISAMQELPMLAFSLLSVYFGTTSTAQPNFRHRSLVAGMLMGIAMGLKLTALLNMTAVVLAFVMSFRKGNVGLLGAAGRVIWYVVGAAGTAVLIAVLFGVGSTAQIISGHFFLHFYADGALGPETFFLNGRLMAAHWDLVVGGTIGVAWMLARGLKTATEWFCLTSLFVMTLFALFYRPWWDINFVNLSLPFILLTSLAIGGVVEREIASLRSHDIVNNAVVTVFICAILAVVGTVNISRLKVALVSNLSRPKIASSSLLKHLRSKKGQSPWIFTQSAIYAFQAGILVPPEYAVFSLNRIWAGEHPSELAHDVITRYQPLLMLIHNQDMQTIAAEISKGSYENVWMDHDYSIFIKRK